MHYYYIYIIDGQLSRSGAATTFFVLFSIFIYILFILIVRKYYTAVHIVITYYVCLAGDLPYLHIPLAALRLSNSTRYRIFVRTRFRPLAPCSSSSSAFFPPATTTCHNNLCAAKRRQHWRLKTDSWRSRRCWHHAAAASSSAFFFPPTTHNLPQAPTLAAKDCQLAPSLYNYSQNLHIWSSEFSLAKA